MATDGGRRRRGTMCVLSFGLRAPRISTAELMGVPRPAGMPVVRAAARMLFPGLAFGQGGTHRRLTIELDGRRTTQTRLAHGRSPCDRLARHGQLARFHRLQIQYEALARLESASLAGAAASGGRGGGIVRHRLRGAGKSGIWLGGGRAVEPRRLHAWSRRRVEPLRIDAGARRGGIEGRLIGIRAQRLVLQLLVYLDTVADDRSLCGRMLSLLRHRVSLRLELSRLWGALLRTRQRLKPRLEASGPPTRAQKWPTSRPPLQPREEHIAVARFISCCDRLSLPRRISARAPSGRWQLVVEYVMGGSWRQTRATRIGPWYWASGRMLRRVVMRIRDT